MRLEFFGLIGKRKYHNLETLVVGNLLLLVVLVMSVRYNCCIAYRSLDLSLLLAR